MSTYSSVSDLLDRLSPDLPAEPAWDDVLVRAASLGAPAPTRSRRGLAVAALAFAALVVAVVATAYALGHPIVRFSDAPRAQSKTFVDFFGRMTVFVPRGSSVMPREARRIVTLNSHTLLVAPTANGGFCFTWGVNEGASCQQRTPHPSASWAGLSKHDSLFAIEGTFPQAAVERVALRYADGTATDIPFVWVTRPIASAFYFFAIPEAHQVRGHQPVRLTFLDAAGAPVASQTVQGIVSPQHVISYKLVHHQVAGYPQLTVPAGAVWAKRRQLFTWTAPTGTRVGLWVAPRRGGGECYWTNIHTGCSDDQPFWPKLRKGKGYVVLCCTIDPKATRVDALFQDGDRVTLAPKNGYLVWPIPRRHFAPGHRLDGLVTYHGNGDRWLAIHIPPGVRGLYPCARPKDFGYGLIMCP
jgi:hypothetical protein